MLAEALRSKAMPEAIYATQERFDETAHMLAGLHTSVYILPERALARLSDLQSSPGIVAVLPCRLREPASLFAQGAPLALLAGVADPGNAGTLLRSAEIFGITGMLFGADGVEAYNPKVVRASMGAIFRLALATIEPQELSALARAHGYTLIGTSGDGKPLPSFSFPERPLIALGNERRGVHSWLAHWDEELSIPQQGEGESLNAAIAGSIVFYAFSQQRSGARDNVSL